MKVRLNTSRNECGFNQEIICPYCGREFTDSWESAPDEDDNDVYCGSCGREFYVNKSIIISYSSIPNDKVFKDWEVGDISDDGIVSEEDEQWANENGKKPCEVVK
jgi:hypothetical protein